MICKVISADILGIDAFQICVEADVSGGLPGFNMVGLPSSEVREARERVERAIVNSGFDFPARRITINLSPAYLRKQGSGLDLPIAVAVLTAMGVIRSDSLDDRLFIGELSLDGSINPIKGVLPICIFAREHGIKSIVVPSANVFEGAAVQGLSVHGVSSLRELTKDLNRLQVKDIPHTDLEEMLSGAYTGCNLDFKDVVGQEAAKKATLVAVSGFHNLLYIGPPGSGKSMMARRIPSIFNRMSVQECLEVSKIYSIAGLLSNDSLVLERPFRSPHQTITDAALMGGLSNPKPGEITLANKGVLFLDELTEFKRNTINELRAPLEDRSIVISRAYGNARFPCDFMLVAATNPCPCGYYPDRQYCHCNELEVSRYLSKIKGPILDRIDICVGVNKVDSSSFSEKDDVMTSEYMRERSSLAQDVQKVRFRDSETEYNSQMSKQEIDTYCRLTGDARDILTKAYDRFNMTARGWYKILKVARTIADLDGGRDINRGDIMEAISYRNSFLNN